MLGWTYCNIFDLIKNRINKSWQRFQNIKHHNIKRFYTEIRKQFQRLNYTTVGIFIYLELITVRSIFWSKYQVPSIYDDFKTRVWWLLFNVFLIFKKDCTFILIWIFPIIHHYLAFGKNSCFWKIVYRRVGFLHGGGTIVW